MTDKVIGKNETAAYVAALGIKRKIRLVQLHHTYSPSSASFNGENHLALQASMRNYHIKTNGWADIGQHFTVFPDGKVVTGRSIEKDPAGIYGANGGAICIECVGNFDEEEMPAAQKENIITITEALCEKFSLKPESDVKYHCWYTAKGKYLGDYIKGKSAKTCPGAHFFGGNTRAAFEKNLLPKIQKEEKQMLESGNDIVWELMNGKYKIEITEVQKAVNALDGAKTDERYSSLYWILYKLVNG